mgnify:CR=1 FL=1
MLKIKSTRVKTKVDTNNKKVNRLWLVKGRSQMLKVKNKSNESTLLKKIFNRKIDSILVILTQVVTF